MSFSASTTPSIQRLASAFTLLALTSSTIATTGILLPLYVYPGADASNWSPALDAIQSHAAVPWLVVANPDSGPGGNPASPDTNYIAGIQALTSHANARVLGYVHTGYGGAPLEALKANVSAWAGFASGVSGAEDVEVQGIFFDESSPAAGADAAYLAEAIGYARAAFADDIVAVCNFGARVQDAAAYYGQGMCDVAVAFESCLGSGDCGGAPAYGDEATLAAEVPGRYAAQSAVLVHDFTGSAADGSAADVSLLQRYVTTAKAYGLGWLYFGSGGYDSLTTAPATVGELADVMAVA
ncbi:Spherulation-specific family 4-domain-containing protein [Xylariaceae sp. FL0016]|nr:Spherulation-specific family 4-domain-containing protein [Xylariaceae sp. FL0016]